MSISGRPAHRLFEAGNHAHENDEATMNPKSSFTTSFKVDRPAAEVFKAITDVRGWWEGQITGDTDALGRQFTYRYKDMHRSTQKVTELVPGKKVAWQVT